MDCFSDEFNIFSNYVNTVRKKQGISLDDLCEGLCSPSLISSWESGKRTPEKLLQDRLLSRLGVSLDTFQHLLPYDKYQRFQMRTKIIFFIQQEQYLKAETLLKEYQQNISSKQPLEKQFSLYMTALLMKLQNQPDWKIYSTFDKALKLSVPKIDQRPLSTFTLSIQELDMVLERAAFSFPVNINAFEEVIHYCSQFDCDLSSKAKIYPKAVVLYCEAILSIYSNPDLTDYNFYLILLDSALAILQKKHSLFYMWEILNLRKTILKCILSLQEDSNSSLKSYFHATAKQIDVLNSLYAHYHVCPKTTQSSLLFLEKGVECINDVIRIRRKMLNLTPSQLCKDICDIRTLKRIEANLSTPQHSLISTLLERLGLPGSYIKSELLLNSSGTKSSLDAFRYLMNEQNQTDTCQLVHIFSQSACLDYTYNLQFSQSLQAYSLWEKGLYTNQDFCDAMKNIISMSIPWNCVISDSPKYFTYNELTYIYFVLLGMNSSSSEYNRCYEILENYYKDILGTELMLTYGGQFEFVLNVVQNHLGNIGNYEASSFYNNAIIPMLFRCKNAGTLLHFLYGNLWNSIESKKPLPPDSMDIGTLKLLAEFATLCNRPDLNHFFLEKASSFT